MTQDLSARGESGPATIGRYRVLARLAGDDAGEVFRAFDPLLERPVVVRVFHWPGLRPDETQAVTLAFFEEVRRAGALSHQGIVPIFDAGDCPSGLFMASEFLEGQSLADWLALEAPRDAEHAMACAEQLAEAIDYAHGQGVTHGDLKPSTIRITDGTLRIGGFGVAAVVHVIRGVVSRPPSRYRAPELAAGPPDVSSDLYAVAALSIDGFMTVDELAGTRGRVPSVLASRGVTEAAWRAFVERALAATPGDRFSTGSGLVEALSMVTGIERRPAMPTWDPLTALGIGPVADAADTDATATSASGRDRPAAAPREADAGGLSADRRHPAGDDDLTVTKM